MTSPSALPPEPTVSVVVATCGRPEMLRSAVRAILGQDYRGFIDLVVVFDHIPIDRLDDVHVGSRRRLRLIPNGRRKGLAGARNTGILTAVGEVVAFCDDDDEWAPEKISMQVEWWRRYPAAVAISCGVIVQSSVRCVERTPPAQVTKTDFLRSRVTAVHPSTILLRSADLRGRVGLVDEDLPGSYGEDYDLLLRATEYGVVASVREPLVTVHWNRPSFFAGKWQNVAGGLTYILRKFPEFDTVPRGSARIAGQVAFAHAALGHRSAARRWAWSALRRDPSQLRAYAALAASWKLVSPQGLLDLVQRGGRGL